MLLAAILLKLGGYGLLRLILMFGEVCMTFRGWVISLSLVGSLYTSVLCITQVDMKSLVAYSSVVHMNFILASLFTLVKIGFMGGFIIMISHGLCSSGLFYIVNIFYRRSHRRLIVLNKGFINIFSPLMIWWFLLCVTNFSFPFSLNFVGEVFEIMALVRWDFRVVFFSRLICFFSGAYSLYLFSFICHGELILVNAVNGGLLVEHLVRFLHFIPLLLIMLNLYMFI